MAKISISISLVSLVLAVGANAASTFIVASNDFVSMQNGGGANYNISVNTQYLGYSGTRSSGTFDGNLESYRFWRTNTSSSVATLTQSGGLIANLSTSSTSLVIRSNARIWDETAPNGSNFDTTEDYADNIGTLFDATGTIDISGILQGSIYIFYGAFKEIAALGMTMSGSGTASDISIANISSGVSYPGGVSIGNDTLVAKLDFTNEDGFTTVSYDYSSGNGTWSGIVVTSVPEPCAVSLLGLSIVALLIRRRR